MWVLRVVCGKLNGCVSNVPLWCSSNVRVHACVTVCGLTLREHFRSVSNRWKAVCSPTGKQSLEACGHMV